MLSAQDGFCYISSSFWTIHTRTTVNTVLHAIHLSVVHSLKKEKKKSWKLLNNFALSLAGFRSWDRSTYPSQLRRLW